MVARLNSYPYGWGPNSVSGWLLSSMFDKISFDEELYPLASDGGIDPTNTMFFAETPSSSKKFEMRYFSKRRTIAVSGEIVYGSTALCGLRRLAMPPLEKPPFYHSNFPICAWFYDVLNKFALRTLAESPIVKSAPEKSGVALPHRALAKPLLFRDLSCPRVGFVPRRTMHNGRGIRNFQEIFDALSAHVKNGGPIINGEKAFKPGCGTVNVARFDWKTPGLRHQPDISFGKQALLANSLDILVGARGMGMTNAVYMRRHSGLLVLSGKEQGASLNFKSDNYPWNPLYALRPSFPTVIGSCPVVFPKDFTSLATTKNASEAQIYAKRCLTRSINFCDLKCQPKAVLEAFDTLVSMMIAQLKRPETSDNNKTQRVASRGRREADHSDDLLGDNATSKSTTAFYSGSNLESHFLIMDKW